MINSIVLAMIMVDFLQADRQFNLGFNLLILNLCQAHLHIRGNMKSENINKILDTNIESSRVLNDLYANERAATPK